MKLTDTEKNETIKEASILFGFSTEDCLELEGHNGGRNLVYKIGSEAFLRISTLTDRTVFDYFAELEYIHFLSNNGANVADSIPSKNGNRVEVINRKAVSLFEVAKGDQIASHGYQYRKDVPIDEYFFNCGKTLGKIHSLSKEYKPVYPRFDFFDKYNEEYFEELIPDDYLCLEKITGRQIKDKFHEHLEKLRCLNMSATNYGMVHFDFSEVNYNIEYDTGKINVFDFDNCRYCWYMFDIANLWSHGLGWIAWCSDVDKRRSFMKSYMQTIINGYRSECELKDEDYSNLEIMVNTVLMENIVDSFEVSKSAGEPFDTDEEMRYNIKCLTDNIPWFGFFSDIFNVDSPFEV